jgi:putative copper resistance protein D
MSESASLAVGPALGSLLGQTHYGHAAVIGLAAWLAAGAALSIRRARAAGRGAFTVGLLGVAVFVVTRSVVSHAGSQGDLTLDVAADAVHLALVCLWTGIVIAGARLVLPDGSAAAPDRSDASRWVSSMSTTATVSIAAIGATGLFKVWRGWATVGSLGTYVASPYGDALLAKLALVGVAAALGGANRFLVLPGLLRSLDAATGHEGGHWRRRFLWILRVEGGTLLLVLAAAAVLSSSEVPGTT